MKLSVLALLTSLSASSFAAEFYIDPVNGSPDNDGSKEAPWRTLEEVFDDRLIESQRWQVSTDSEPYLVPVNPGAPVKAGDTLILNSGYHGNIDEQDYVNAKDIAVTAGKDQHPQVSRIRLRGVANWVFSGLSISPSHAPGPTVISNTLVHVIQDINRPNNSNIQFLDNEVFTIKNTSEWDVDAWKENALHGITVDAVNATIANNKIYNVEAGIQALNDNTVISGNTVKNFTYWVAIQVRGDHSEVSRNLVANAISIDGSTHGFKYGLYSSSSSENPVVNDVVVRGNWFINDLHHPDPSLLYNFRGISLKSKENWVIENNLFQLNNSGAFFARGLKNSHIINNTLIDSDNDAAHRPSISVQSDSGAFIGGGNTIRNNVAHSISADEGSILEHNVIIDY